MWTLLFSGCFLHTGGSVLVSESDAPPSDAAVVDSEGAASADSSVDSDIPPTGDLNEPAGDTDIDGPDTDGAVDAEPPPAGLCSSYAPAVSTGRVDDAALDEISGIAASRKNPGIFWVLEDSGNEAELYALDEDGKTHATVAVSDASNVDWEDLAIAPCGDDWCLWIGDIGDRGGGRSDFVLYRVAEPMLGDDATLGASATAFPFRYPGTAEDAEGLAILPDGTPLVVTKRANATAGLFTLPSGADVLVAKGEVATGVSGEDLTARATAADLTPDGKRLLIRTYMYLFEVDATDLAAPPRVTTLVPGLEIQGEAAAYDPSQRAVWHLSEGERPRIHVARCR